MASIYIHSMPWWSRVDCNTCFIKNTSSETLQADISQHQQQHGGAANNDVTEGATNNDVSGVYIYHSPKLVQFTAASVSNEFKNVIVLKIAATQLKEISRNDLMGLENLIGFRINDSPLQTLPGDLFENTPKLEYVSFRSNRIKYIGKDLMRPLDNIKFIDFRGNETINLYHGINEDVSNPGVTLKKLKTVMRKQCRQKYLATSCSDYLLLFWTEGLFSDFTIRVNIAEFKVHRCILSIASPVFDVMFRHKDVQENKENQMEIVEFSAEAVREFLCFIYTEAVPESPENAMELYGLAAKYEVNNLLLIAEDLILDNINDENAHEVLVLGNLHNNDYFKEDAFNEIKDLFIGMKLVESLKERPDDLKIMIDGQIEMELGITVLRDKYRQLCNNVNK